MRGDGTTLTTVGDGDGTTHGDITVGAGADITAGDTHTADGAGLESASAGAAIMVGVATTVVTGTAHTTTEGTMAEATPTCLDEEVTLPVFRELHYLVGLPDIQVGIEITADAPMQPYHEAIIWPTEVLEAIAIGQT